MGKVYDVNNAWVSKILFWNCEFLLYLAFTLWHQLICTGRQLPRHWIGKMAQAQTMSLQTHSFFVLVRNYLLILYEALKHPMIMSLFLHQSQYSLLSWSIMLASTFYNSHTLFILDYFYKMCESWSKLIFLFIFLSSGSSRKLNTVRGANTDVSPDWQLCWPIHPIHTMNKTSLSCPRRSNPLQQWDILNVSRYHESTLLIL